MMPASVLADSPVVLEKYKHIYGNYWQNLSLFFFIHKANILLIYYIYIHVYIHIKSSNNDIFVYGMENFE